MAPEHAAYPILVVDDETDNLDTFRFNFKKQFSLLTAEDGDKALRILRENDVAVIVTDQRMPRMTGLDLLRKAREIRPDAVGVIVTAFTDVDVLVSAINLGQVYRYVTKPWDSREVRGVLSQALERFHLIRENRRLVDQLRGYAGYLEREVNARFDFGRLVGNSQTLESVLQRVEQVAPTDSTVLLRGETGTGKELVARAIHINSPREARPFVRVSCAALAPGVLESELFGHEKGAFTGALARRAGRFEVAEGGTLFLDEVGDLPLEVQVKLLRVLQEREIERVGSSETIEVDVRIVSATHRDLEDLVASGMFREDLYYRLNVFPIALPPLRDRAEDIPSLVEHFIEKYAERTKTRGTSFSPGALAKLAAHDWPGNVRELENVVERALIVATAPVVSERDLQFSPRPAAVEPREPPAAGAAPMALRFRDAERREIVQAIEAARGNIAAAARALGLNRSTLYYRLRKHDLLHLLPTQGDGEPRGATDAEK